MGIRVLPACSPVYSRRRSISARSIASPSFILSSIETVLAPSETWTASSFPYRVIESSLANPDAALPMTQIVNWEC